MGKFKFKLQTLLNVKIQMEKSVKNDLGKATFRYEEEKRILEDIERTIQQEMENINQMVGKGVFVGKLKEYNSFLGMLKNKAWDQKENINKAREIVDRYREELIKAVKEREILEKLRDKKYIEYQKEQLQEEQKINDERVSFDYGKSNSEE